jgi:hypothetical protein
MCLGSSTKALGLALVGREPPLGSELDLVGLALPAVQILVWVGLEPLSELLPALVRPGSLSGLLPALSRCLRWRGLSRCRM